MLGGTLQVEDNKDLNNNRMDEERQVQVQDANRIESVNQEQENQDKKLFKGFADIEKEVQQIISPQASDFRNMSNENNVTPLEQEQERPSPAEQSSSNNISAKAHRNKQSLSNELIQLTKKPTTTVRKQKKVRYYISNFEPYLPTFLDELHKQHTKNIIRVGQNYQAQVQPQPIYEKVHRPMKHLQIWKGSDNNFSKEALKKFKELYGESRTEEELILLKHRLQIDNWNDLIKQMVSQKSSGKKSTLILGSTNNGIGATTRNK